MSGVRRSALASLLESWDLALAVAMLKRFVVAGGAGGIPGRNPMPPCDNEWSLLSADSKEFWRRRRSAVGGPP